ncbi:terpenoid synthase [Mollisia scopiformis]|uniref:Terpene synthase n=1 Tax=Mollisia scopiformis TaxID=149040 RepID=A0A194XID7_MOLSC|nr:terpenoid synthase [Mollisia scopiformis]KUJ19990.1 terpenoid synthase [Mollisia scopiformis]
MGIHSENKSQTYNSVSSSKKEDNEREIIKIPDLFELFMSRTPTVNPFYEHVKDQALEWATDICHYNTQEAERMRRGDFAYFAAVSVPDADTNKLRTVNDWLNWVFVFDDQLDDGHFSRNGKTVEAFEYIDSMIAVLDGETRPESDLSTQALRDVLKSIWERVNGDPDCADDAKLRWKQNMTSYLAALRASMTYEPSDNLEKTVGGYIDYRFHSIGVLPLFSFIEYAYNLTIPDEVFKNRSMQEMQRVGVEIQMLANDCVSYRREKANDCPHNIIYLLRYHGFSEQEAYNHVQILLRNRYKEWYLAQAQLPTWGERVDREVQWYIKGMQDVALANANWSFRTERYFGGDREHVRETREVPSKVEWLPGILVEGKAEV